jgi:predicted transcriptional regulator
MSRMLNIYLDDDTEKRLEDAAKYHQRSIEDLAESAVAEAALQDAKDRGTL